MRKDLLDLARSLRFRVQLAEESEWSAAPRPAQAPPIVRSAPKLPGADKAARLEALAHKIRSCKLCPLGDTRLNAVPGVGSPDARVLFIGEGPGFDEDHQGEPFVGKSGQLLDKILASIGLSRQTVYIANIVKCHPMQNPKTPEARGNDRPPFPNESAACRPYLDEQIRIIDPAVIVTLGAVAARGLLGEGVSIKRVRGQWHEYRPAGGAPIKVLPTFHPAALLRDPALKKDVWTDMKNLRQELSQ